MTEIYWLLVIGNLGCLSVLVFIIAICALIVLSIGYYSLDVIDDDDKKKQDVIVKWLRRSSFYMVISVFGMVFIPGDKEIMAIYGIGGTIDYIKNNDKAKELPDKVVDALTRYVDSIEKDEEKK